MSLNLNWFKSYDTKHTYFPLHFFPFLRFFLSLCHNFWTNDQLNFSFMEDVHVIGKKWLEMVVKGTFNPVSTVSINSTLQNLLSTLSINPLSKQSWPSFLDYLVHALFVLIFSNSGLQNSCFLGSFSLDIKGTYVVCWLSEKIGLPFI